jgi:hypothetical protein
LSHSSIRGSLPGPRDTNLQRVSFVIGDRSETLTIDPELPFSSIKQQLAPIVGCEVSEFNIILGKSEISGDMTLRDLEIQEGDILTLLRESTCDMYLLIGVIPRRWQLSVDQDKTLSSIELQIRNRWDLTKIPIEFVVGDPGEGEWQVVSPLAKFHDFDWKVLALGIREQAIGEEPIDLISNKEGSLERETGGEKPTILMHNEEEEEEEEEGKAYTFSIEQRNLKITLKFRPGATIRDAKVSVAQKCEVDGPDFVILQLSGKALRDNFILERVCRGGQAIIVVLKDMSEVILVSAKSMRS